MIIAVASRKASPGVTTLATLIAARWPGPEAVRLVLEADPSGGTLAARWSTAHGLTWEPGLLALSTSRRPATPATVVDVAQPVAEGLWVAAAPPGPDQVGAALTRLGEAGAEMLAAAPGLVTVADCGRLSVDSPALALARRAELTVLVCRPRLEEVHALVPAVAELVDAGCRLGLVTVGDEPYGPAEVAANLGLDLLGVVPVDGRAADLYLRQGLTAGRAFRRSALAAAAADVVAAIAVRCPDPGAAVDAPASTSPPPATPTLVAPSAPASTSASTSTPAVTSVAASGAGAPGAVASGPPVGPGPRGGRWPGRHRGSGRVGPGGRPGRAADGGSPRDLARFGTGGRGRDRRRPFLAPVPVAAGGPTARTTRTTRTAPAPAARGADARPRLGRPGLRPHLRPHLRHGIRWRGGGAVVTGHAGRPLGGRRHRGPTPSG